MRGLTGARLCVRNCAHISHHLPSTDVQLSHSNISMPPYRLTHRYALYIWVCFHRCSRAHHGAGQHAEQRRRDIKPHAELKTEQKKECPLPMDQAACLKGSKGPESGGEKGVLTMISSCIVARSKRKFAAFSMRAILGAAIFD
jgi:hypothetical protein